jgi:hypothetical protein
VLKALDGESLIHLKLRRAARVLSAVAAASATTAVAATAAVAATTAAVTAAAAAAAGRLPAPHLVEAVATVNRSVTTRLERYLGRLAAVAADHVEELALRARGTAETAATARVAAVALGAPGAAAITATLRLRESPLGIEFLVICGKDELCTAVDAG